MIEATREQRLLMNLARASSAGKQSAQLEAFFEHLDHAGWLIELARVHVRLCTMIAQPHGEWARFLQLNHSRSYRLSLIRNDAIKAALVDLARFIVKQDGENMLGRVQQSIEYSRLQRTVTFTGMGGMRRRGRPNGESFAVSEDVGTRLEELRLRCGLKIKHWAVRIGTSENTYRRRLEEGVVPPEWMEAALITVERQEASLLAARQAEIPVSDEELRNAFNAVWVSYTRSFDRIHGTAKVVSPPVETPEEKAERERREDEELMKFVPSFEDEGEDDLDIGAVDELDRVEPKNLDEESA